MTRSAMHRKSSSGGLHALSLVLLGALTGCGSAAPAETSEESSGVAQDPLSWSIVCGGHTGHTCSPDKLCVPIFSRGCPGPDQAGLCIPRPDHCPPVSDPVCGCDGATYANLCAAAAAGSAMVHRGACTAPPVCGAGGAVCPGAGTCSNGDDAVCDHRGGLSGLFSHHHHGTGQPASGGACECKATLHCPTGQRFNDSAAVCACEAEHDPCSGVACKSGELCVPHADGTASCDPDPCVGMACKSGEQCVPKNGAPTCVPNACMGMACPRGQVCVVLPNGSPACQ